MKKTLYFVDELQVEMGLLTGFRAISVYEMKGDAPKLLTDLEVNDDDNVRDEIQSWLDDNGYGDEEFELVQL